MTCPVSEQIAKHCEAAEELECLVCNRSLTFEEQVYDYTRYSCDLCGAIQGKYYDSELMVEK